MDVCSAEEALRVFSVFVARNAWMNDLSEPLQADQSIRLPLKQGR